MTCFLLITLTLQKRALFWLLIANVTILISIAIKMLVGYRARKFSPYIMQFKSNRVEFECDLDISTICFLKSCFYSCNYIVNVTFSNVINNQNFVTLKMLTLYNCLDLFSKICDNRCKHLLM